MSEMTICLPQDCTAILKSGRDQARDTVRIAQVVAKAAFRPNNA